MKEKARSRKDEKRVSERHKPGAIWLNIWDFGRSESKNKGTGSRYIRGILCNPVPTEKRLYMGHYRMISRTVRQYTTISEDGIGYRKTDIRK